MPKAIQRKRTTGSRMPFCAVSVTRPGPWGNPFRVGHRYGWWGMVLEDPIGYPGAIKVTTPEQSVDLFRLYAELRNALEPTWLAPLRGKDLACFCPLGVPCHRDVLLELSNRKACSISRPKR